MKRSQFQAGVPWVMLAAILWGTSGVTTQGISQLAATNPLSVSFLRLAVSVPVLLGTTWRILGRRLIMASRRDWLLLLLMGMLVAADQALYVAAISYSGVTIATMITICGAPILVTLFTTWREKRWPSADTLICIGLALLGTMLLVGGSSSGDGHLSSSLGILFAILCATSYAGVILLGKALTGRCHPLQVTAIGFTVGALLLGIAAQISGFASSYPAQGWLLILYIGVVPTALAYGLFFAGIQRTPAPIASVLVLLEPLTAAVLAWLLFGERLSLLGIIGAVLLLAAIYWLSNGDRLKPEVQAVSVE